MAANPNASLETLIELAADENDFMSRLNAAKNPYLTHTVRRFGEYGGRDW